MGIIASSSGGGEFEAVPVGTHRAICYKLADAGTREEKFKDEDAKKRHTIFIFLNCQIFVHPRTSRSASSSSTHYL